MRPPRCPHAAALENPAFSGFRDAGTCARPQTVLDQRRDGSATAMSPQSPFRISLRSSWCARQPRRLASLPSRGTASPVAST